MRRISIVFLWRLLKGVMMYTNQKQSYQSDQNNWSGRRWTSLSLPVFRANVFRIPRGSRGSDRKILDRRQLWTDTPLKDGSLMVPSQVLLLLFKKSKEYELVEFLPDVCPAPAYKRRDKPRGDDIKSRDLASEKKRQQILPRKSREPTCLSTLLSTSKEPLIESCFRRSKGGLTCPFIDPRLMNFCTRSGISYLKMRLTTV